MQETVDDNDAAQGSGGSRADGKGAPTTRELVSGCGSRAEDREDAGDALARQAYVRFDLATLRDPDGDPAAFEREWRRVAEHFAPRLQSYFQQDVPAPDERDDLVQHILIKAALNIRTVQSPGALWNWLRKIGHNRVADVRRSAKASARHIELLTAEAVDDDHGGDTVIDRRLDPYEREGQLGRRIAALSPLDRQLLDLVADQVPHDEIAAALGLASAEASRQRWSRLRRRLRAS